MAAKAARSCTACEYSRSSYLGQRAPFLMQLAFPPAVHTEETSSPTEFDVVLHFKSQSLVLVPGTLGSSFLCLPGREVSITSFATFLSGALSHHSYRASQS